MRVWVTRAQPGADATAARLRALGHGPIVAPVLDILWLPAAIDLAGVAALAFTSANGVAGFARLRPDRHLPVFTVGAATAHVAREAGFAAVTSADGDVDALAALILDQSGLEGSVLHPGGQVLAGDLVGALEARGVAARAVAVYETTPVTPSDAVLADLAAADAVLVHSSRAGAIVARLPQARGLAALCISAAAAAPLQAYGFARILRASRPDESSLLALLDGMS